jgi:hypothetical protein
MNKYLSDTIIKYLEYKYVYILYKKSYDDVKSPYVLDIFKSNSLEDINMSNLEKSISIEVNRVINNFNIKGDSKIHRIEISEEDGNIFVYIENIYLSDVKIYGEKFVLEKRELL